MDKKALALWGMMVASPFLVEAETKGIPAKLDRNTLEVVSKGMEKVFSLKNFFTEEVEQAVDSLKLFPQGFIQEIILDNENISDNSNTLNENTLIAKKANKIMADLRGEIFILENRINSLENNKLELAREYFAKKGKIDMGDKESWKKFQENNPRKVRKIITLIEENPRNNKLSQSIKDNDVKDYSEIQQRLDELRKILATVEAINNLFNIRKTVSGITLKDIEDKSDFLKTYNLALEEIFNNNFTDKELSNKIANYELFLDLEKGKEKMKMVQQIIDIYDKLSGKTISYENNAEIQSVINILKSIRELKTGNIMNIAIDSGNFVEILNKIVKIAGLVGLDEDRRKIKDYLEILEKNNYPDEFSIYNLEDFLKDPDGTGYYLNDLIKKLSISLENHLKYDKNLTETSISTKDSDSSTETINRFNRLEKLKSLVDRWNEMPKDMQSKKYEYFSKIFGATLSNHYGNSENSAKYNELLPDLESIKKDFWKKVYAAQINSGLLNAHTGIIEFGGMINIHKNGDIEIIKK